MHEEVLGEMEVNESDALAVYAYISEKDQTLHFLDDFRNLGEEAFHLSEREQANFC